MVIDTSNWRVLIPARAGSKGIPNKNILEVGGLPLLAYSILVARQIVPAHRVWVSTDSHEYANVAVRFGGSAPFIRPTELAQDSTPDIEVFRHAIDFEDTQEEKSSEFWLHLRPTTPLRTPEVVKTAMKNFLNDPEASGLRSVHETLEAPQKTCLVDASGYVTSLCGDSDADALNLPRQLYPPAYAPNGYVDVIRRDSVLGGYLHGDRCLAFETQLVIDIDHLTQIEGSFEGQLESLAEQLSRQQDGNADEEDDDRWLSTHSH